MPDLFTIAVHAAVLVRGEFFSSADFRYHPPKYEGGGAFVAIDTVVCSEDF